MTSPNYSSDLDWSFGVYPDSGGVHVNSGVGNKTAYLISQGGAFNGQMITGIDGGDTGLTKTGKLYFDTITKLTSGGDYANLAAVLEQSCNDFVSTGTAGFTGADCVNVAAAVVATELRTTPPAAPQPADAGRGCPTGTTIREIFNGETDNPAAKFTGAGGLWNYGVDPGWGSNATSGRDSWFGRNGDPSQGDPAVSSLTMTNGIALPAGQPSFLHFQQWRVFDWVPGSPAEYYDGGTVEINGADAGNLTWVNGPQQTLIGAPAQKAFAGDSFGWTASQLDLSSFAGQTVKPQFTLRADAEYAYVGWWLDDVVIYTCDVPAPVVAPPPPAAVPTQLASKMTLKFKGGRTAKVIATVKTASGVVTSGKVKFNVDKNRAKAVIKIRKGKATLKLRQIVLRQLGRGRHKIVAKFVGSPTARASKATVRFKIRPAKRTMRTQRASVAAD